MLASEVMDAARANLNDTESQLFTNEVLLPYLKNAYEALQSSMQENGLPITFEVSTALAITAGATVVSSTSTPPLPTDIIEPIALWERPNIGGRWLEMEKVDYFPSPDSTPRERFYVWHWGEDELKFPPATVPRQIQIRYLKSLPSISGESTDLPVRGAKLFLAYKTAAEAAEMIGQNRMRADRLESKAQIELGKFINIRVKGTQGRAVRRRPFNGSFRWPTPLPY